jgi:hypothetical protein
MNLAQTKAVMEKLERIESYAKTLGVGFYYDFQVDNYTGDEAPRIKVRSSVVVPYCKDSSESPATNQ